MPYRTAFFESVAGDRKYTADRWAQMLAAMQTGGYIPNFGSELAVTETNPPTMGVLVGTGAAFVNGRYFEVYTTPLTLNLDAASATQHRRDRVVLKLDLTAGVRDVVPYIKKGANAATSGAAVPPTLQRDASIYEISLAQIYVAPNDTAIQNAEITDERNNEAVAGMSVPPGIDAHAHTGAAHDGQLIEVYKDHVESFDLDPATAEDVMFHVPRTPLSVRVVLRGRMPRAGLLAAHNHGGALTTGGQSQSHTHAITVQNANINHAHSFTTSSNGGHLHSAGSDAGSHDHLVKTVGSPSNGLAYGPGQNTDSSGLIVGNGTHNHGNTGSVGDHAHSGNTGNTDPVHGHAASSGNASQDHTHGITIASQGIGGLLTQTRPDSTTIFVNGIDRTATLGGPFGASGSNWDTGFLDITAWAVSGWNTLTVQSTTGGRLKVHVLSTF